MAAYKVVIIGENGVGKSCLTIQLVSNRFIPEYDPTLEDSYRKRFSVDDESQILDVFDTSGAEDYSSIREQYMKIADGFICVYSISNESTFEEVDRFFEIASALKRRKNVPFVIIGNKCDLDGEREVSKARGEDKAKRLKCSFFECSAKEDVNVTVAFAQLIREINASRRTRNRTSKKMK
jgi:GTPase KRas protein